MKVIVFIGDNSGGKTCRLRKMMDILSKSEYVTNLFGRTYESYGYDLDCMDDLCVETCCDYEILSNGELVFKGDDITKRLSYIFALLCSKAKYVFLDEPERGMNVRETLDLLSAINSLCSRDKTIIITTHALEFTCAYGAEVCWMSEKKDRLQKWGERV